MTYTVHPKVVREAKRHAAAIYFGAAGFILTGFLSISAYWIRNQANRAINILDARSKVKNEQDGRVAVALERLADDYERTNKVLPRASMGQGRLKSLLPESRSVVRDSVGDCLEAVLAGHAYACEIAPGGQF